MKTEFRNGGTWFSAPFGDQWLKNFICAQICVLAVHTMKCEMSSIDMISNRSGEPGTPIKGTIIFGSYFWFIFGFSYPRYKYNHIP